MLTAEGILRHMGNHGFIISSPLIRAIIIKTVTSTRELKRPIPDKMPYEMSQLNVEKLIIGALPLFDSQLMENAVSTSFKINECNYSRGSIPVPCENCYQIELFNVIRKVSEHCILFI
jgi:hypothetical protein